uniref:Uncharacterized protein n=1 Tax=viral metagenome TaxID=1070528 RepID=A0A6C0IJ24_9ZZZZ
MRIPTFKSDPNTGTIPSVDRFKKECVSVAFVLRPVRVTTSTSPPFAG